jgi:membrane-associated protease RseP (regulator of RpoE activity)
MKRILLIAGSAFALNGALVHGAFAADAASSTDARPAASPTSANAAASDTPGAKADAAAKAEAARKELGEVRAQMQELSRKMAALSVELGEGGPRSYAYRYIGDPDRAIIGVVLDRDDKGVRITGVTPNGPAARAGLRDGDVITSIDGKPVGKGVGNAQSALANLKDGQAVTIAYARGEQKSTVKVEAQRHEAWNWPMLMSEDPEHPFLPKDFNERISAGIERATREAERNHARIERSTREAMKHVRPMPRLAMPWWGLNLAPLNADLGHYFGTDKGVLVIAADDDSLPGIKAGDVITNIAGETVDRPEDALRALRDQQAGKDVPIKLLRDRKPLALDMKAPEFKSIFNLRMVPPVAPAPAAVPAPAAMPAPPAPAAPPTPPAIAGADID